jgi:sterol desaturase/sphingolipid hydroxylase (fatty acid hydroxylase superfamily)
MFADVATFLLAPVHRLGDLGDPFSAASLAGALIFAALLMLHRTGTAPGRAGVAARLDRLRAFVRAGFGRRIWTHPSTRLDLRLFFVTTFFYATGAVEWVVTSRAVEAGVVAGLDGLFGHVDHSPAGWATIAAVTVLDLLIFELAYWFAHWLLHRVPVLWSFHALHHSAEVLTPLTEWRQHPVELFLIPAINALFLGTFFGFTHHLLGPEARPATLFGFDLLQVVLVFTLLHLRHTHLWLTLPGIWAKLIQTPAHHQIHHSADPRHFDKNLGLFLSVWDWAFGTLWIPHDDDRRSLVLGLGAAEGHHGVIDAWVSPVIDGGRVIAATLRPSARDAVPRPAPAEPTRLPAAE